MVRTTPRRRRPSTEDTVTVTELLSRARTVTLRRRPDDTAPLPVVSFGEVGARHRRPSVAGVDSRKGPATRLALGGAGMLAAVAVFGGLLLGRSGGGPPPGDITDGAVVPPQVSAPVVTIEGVARAAETPTTTQVPDGPRQETTAASESAAPAERSESIPEAQDSREQAREAVESGIEELKSRLNEIPVVPRW